MKLKLPYAAYRIKVPYERTKKRNGPHGMLSSIKNHINHLHQLVERPKIFSVEPSVGISGMLVKIRGMNFLSTQKIRFGNSPVERIYGVRKDVIVCEVPPGIPSGMVEISVGGFSDIAFKHVALSSKSAIDEICECFSKPKQQWGSPSSFSNEE